MQEAARKAESEFGVKFEASVQQRISEIRMNHVKSECAGSMINTL